MYPHCEAFGDGIHDHYIDWVHPNDHGYETYAQIITAQLTDSLDEVYQNEEPIKHSCIGDDQNLIDNAHFVYTNDNGIININGWEYERGVFSYLGGRYGGRLTSSVAGSSFELKFYGKNLGVFYGADVNRGKISITVDNEEPIILDGYRWASNPKEFPIIDFLQAGEHTAKFTLLEEKNEKSNSHFFEIGVFLVS